MYILGYIYYLNQTLTGGLAYPPADHVRTGNRNQAPAKRLGRRAPGAGLIGAVRRWWAQRAAERDLQALSDRMLRDIGIQRGEIPKVVARLIANEEAKAARAVARDHRPATRAQPGHLKLAGCG
jgi:uncharacterized protein YjiS (DUF1127 family)